MDTVAARFRHLDRDSRVAKANNGLVDNRPVLIEGTRVAEPVAARPGATVWQVTREGREPIERRIEVRRLVDERRPIDDVDGEIVEPRQTLASRAATRRARRGRRSV